MKVTFGDVGDSPQGRAQRIRSLFVAGRTIQAHTDKCINEKLWTESELSARAASGCREEVRAALGILVDGVPFAGPTAPKGRTGKKGRPAPIWKQIEFWTKDDYVYNFNAYARRGGENIAVANNIATACLRRYGTGPKTLRIVEEEDDEAQYQ